jgi:hypothetical protein
MAAWNAGDLARYLDLYDATVLLHGYSADSMDKTAVSGFYHDIFANLTAPDAAAPQIELTHVVPAENYVSCVFVMSGVQRRKFHGRTGFGPGLSHRWRHFAAVRSDWTGRRTSIVG